MLFTFILNWEKSDILCRPKNPDVGHQRFGIAEYNILVFFFKFDIILISIIFFLFFVFGHHLSVACILSSYVYTYVYVCYTFRIHGLT